MPETWPDHIPRPIAIIGWDGTRYSAFRLRPDGTLQVRGEDQLFSFQDVLHTATNVVISGADGWIASTSPPAGQVWVVTAIAALDITSPTTEHRYHTVTGAVTHRFYRQTEAFPANEMSHWGGHVYLNEDDAIRAYFIGGLAADSCMVYLNGFRFTVET